MIHHAYDELVRSWLEEHRDQLINDLMTLMRIPSVRGEALPGAPYGAVCQQAIEASEKLFASLGFATRMEAERGYALAFHGSGEKCIGLFGHADVVPPGDGWIHTQPFDPVVKDGMLIGRGCADDKAGIIIAAYIMAMVRDLSLPVKSRLLGYAGANEETGMADIQSFVAHEENPDICLVPDGDFPCSLGEKSKLIMWAECDTPFTAIRDFHGGLSTNVVLGSVDITMDSSEALRHELNEKTAGNEAFSLQENSDGTLSLHVKGVSGHASWPEGTVNAGALAAAVLAECATLPESDRAIMATVRDYVTDPYGIGSGIAHEDPRFGRLSAANGLVETVDGKLRLSMDTRYGTTLPSEELKETLRRVWGSRGWTLPSLDSREGFHGDDNSPVPAMIRDICHEMTGLDRPLFRMAGGTYSHFLKNGFSMGVQTEWAGSQPKMTFPEGHGHVHQPDESLDIDGFLLAIRLMVQILLQCDQLLHS